MSVIESKSVLSDIEEIKKIVDDRSKEVVRCRYRNDSGNSFYRMLKSILSTEPEEEEY